MTDLLIGEQTMARHITARLDFFHPRDVHRAAVRCRELGYLTNVTDISSPEQACYRLEAACAATSEFYQPGAIDKIGDELIPVADKHHGILIDFGFEELQVH
jgi:hypothetical protein